MSTGHDTLTETPTTVLPTDPFTSVRYHFGMLLGVDDFETEQGYHRGRTSLHNAWLHGAGVVWGLAVELNMTREELRVGSGLALDAAGNELHVATPACLSVPAWYAQHADDADVAAARRITATGVELDAHVVARFRPCLARPVPAFAEPCEGSAAETAYSRVSSAVEFLLVPAAATAAATAYHRLRVLFGLEPPALPDDQPVVDGLAAVAARPDAERATALLDVFRALATLDGVDLEPAATPDGDEPTLFPGVVADGVVLADVTGLALEPDGDGWKLAGGAVDYAPRRTHVATATIQELLCGPALSGGAPVPGAGGGGPADEADAGGPRVDRASVAFPADDKISFGLDKPIRPGSAVKDAFRVSALGDTGAWRHVGVADVDYDETSNAITLRLNRSLGGGLVRLLVRGTGTTPLLGTDDIPLAGARGGPAGGEHDGRDFVHQTVRS
jgi:hypothetical protein